MRDRLQIGITFGGHKVWTSQEEQIIKRLYPDWSAIERRLGHRTPAAIRAQAGKLGLRKRLRRPVKEKPIKRFHCADCRRVVWGAQGKRCRCSECQERHTYLKRISYNRIWRASPSYMTPKRVAAKKASAAKWRRANPEKVRAARKRFRALNPDKWAQYKTRWRIKYRDRIRAYRREYNKKNRVRLAGYYKLRDMLLKQGKWITRRKPKGASQV